MKIAVFIDYWNLQLTINQRIAQGLGVDDYRTKIDWKNIGYVFAKEACTVVGIYPSDLSYEGVYIYTSFNPSTEEGRKFRNWATTWLDRQPGVNVQIRERRPKGVTPMSDLSQGYHALSPCRMR
jgi:hypothetical protein